MAARLTHRVQVLRSVRTNTGAGVTTRFENDGSPVWAARDADAAAEGVAAAQVQATISAVFMVRASSFTRSITAKDRISAGTEVFDIVGVKPRGVAFLDIVAVARADT